MNAVVLFNGLGNQMSQYAFYLAKKHIDPNCKFFFDPSSTNIHNGYELERIFGIQMPSDSTISKLKKIYKLYSYRILRGLRIPQLMNLIGIKRIVENVSYDFDVQNLKYMTNGICFYWGGWHSEKYFKSIEKEIREKFTFPEVTDSFEFLDLLAKIIKDNESVSIHVRRGDYLKQPKKSRYQYYYCDENYYLKAIKYIKSNFANAHFYVFSDDIEWCRSFMPKDVVTFVDFNKGSNSWRDMSLMTKCHHHILSNSTFSWWGAWLATYENSITIRPSKFLSNHETKDFYPEQWVNVDLLPECST